METLQHLRAIPLFSELPDADLALIETLVKPVHYQVNSPVCRQGEIGDALYIVESGELQVSHVDARGIPRELDVLQPNHFFGETALVFGEPYPTSVTARTDAHLLTLSREDLACLLSEHRDLRDRLTRGMSPELKAKFTQCRLPWLMRGEVPIVFVHKHWWALVQSLPKPLGVIFLLVVAAISVTTLIRDTTAIAFTWGFVLLFVSAILVFVTLDWYNDLHIVTNRRVIDLERILLVRVERMEAPIEKIQNVEVRQPRLLHKLIGVSDIVIATASIRGTIVLAAVPHGAELRDKIFEQMQRIRAQHEYEEREQLKQRLREQINPSPPTPEETPAAAEPPKPARPARPSLRQNFSGMFKLRIESSGTVTWRKHVFALIHQIWRPVVAWLALVAIVVGLNLRGNLPSLLLINLALSLAMIVTFGWAIWEWVDWQNDIYMVTRDRLIDLELDPLGVTKKSVTAPLVAITNVSYRQPSLWTLILNIGDVVIETAGATGQMTFVSVSKPREIANEIMQHVENTRARQLQIQREQQRDDLLQWFGAYHSILQDEGAARPSGAPTPPPDSGSTTPRLGA